MHERYKLGDIVYLEQQGSVSKTAITKLPTEEFPDRFILKFEDSEDDDLRYYASRGELLERDTAKNRASEFISKELEAIEDEKKFWESKQSSLDKL